MFVLGMAGHVDHGKSTLLRCLTGLEPDRLPEEKKRGMTIDLNFVWMTTSKGDRVGIVDVPGHKKFVKNMVSGTTGVDGFLFVVAADDGWMPQSEEHLRVLTHLGIREGVGIVTKVDLVSMERVGEVFRTLGEKLKDSLGNAIPIIRFTASDPKNVAGIKDAIESLLVRLPAARDIGAARLWIDRVFVPKGMGVVVTGTLREGILQQGDEVFIYPIEKTAVVKSLQCYQTDVTKVTPVCRVAIGLSRISAYELSRGCLLQAGRRVPLTRKVDTTLEISGPQGIRNSRLHMHVGTAKVPALIIPMGPGPMGKGFARIKLQSPIPLRSGDRFLLRTPGEEMTVGAGKVIDPNPLAKSHKRALGMVSLWEKSVEGFVRYELAKNQYVGEEELLNKCAYSKEEIRTVLVELACEISHGVFVAKNAWEGWNQQVIELLKERHDKQLSGVEEAEIAKQLAKLGCPVKYLDAALKNLVFLKKVVRAGNLVRLFGISRLSDAENSFLHECLEKSGGLPFALKEITDSKARSPELWRLVKEGRLISLGEDYFMDAQAYRSMTEVVVGHLKTRGSTATSDLKTLLNTSRKNAVLILEKMDRDRVTYLKDGVRRLLRNV